MTPPVALQARQPITTLKLPPYRAGYNMADQVTPEVTTAADLAKLNKEGKYLNPQELKELGARIKAQEKMARFEDRLKALENRKRSRQSETENDAPERLSDPSSYSNHSIVRRSIEQEDSESSSTTTEYPNKRRRYTKGIKVVPSYTLRVSSSLRE